MSYPSEGLEGFYRNSFIQIKKRCEKQYDLSRFEYAASYPFLDHQAPPFSILVEFCIDASQWLEKDKDNVVAIHCKAGKGRTGTVISALLLHLHLASNAKEAIELYGKQRTHNLKGVTIPSQIRYVHYYDFMLKNVQLYESNKNTSLIITQIVIHELPESLENNKEFELKIFGKDESCIYQTKSTKSKGKDIFYFWFNTAFVFIMNHNVLHLKKQDLDLAFRDEEFHENFSVGITFIKA
ncbi:protein-tyrosine phosphatase-like protein [Cokeromyces recurvatus]|uniref:protein-tyrosine phosphatase-like protein n=1 Tax=Cokeromyces recurvatus TaxID=90255 RepID=UPI002220DBB2|nr:protein-tyrosine phosphatase-like protein [Cokeromyces recurvatus]KAI7897665.1 protein-tyrosine phosphatase-like protein [Cokeromyces recurvatus]